MPIKKLFLSGAATAILSLAGLAATTIGASAYVACNRDGDCWHTESRYHQRGVRFDYHPDDWYFHRQWDNDRDHHWRGYHQGRGYWRGGVWVTL